MSCRNTWEELKFENRTLLSLNSVGSSLAIGLWVMGTNVAFISLPSMVSAIGNGCQTSHTKVLTHGEKNWVPVQMALNSLPPPALSLQ